MKTLLDYHHFRKELLDQADRVAPYERYVVDTLIASTLPDSQRESSIAFELKHQAAIIQLARILARKRGLPIDTCSVGALLHDIYVIVQGKYEDHAHRGAPIAKEILDQIGGFAAEEESQIGRIVYHHSDKHIWSHDPFEEFGKDADVLDCFLYPGAFGYYLAHKPLGIFFHYLVRAKNAWKELDIVEDPEFHLLDNYGSHWFGLSLPVAPRAVEFFLSLLLCLTDIGAAERVYPPAYCVTRVNKEIKFYTNEVNWTTYLEDLRKARTNIGRYFASRSDLPGDPWAGLGGPAPEFLDVVRYSDLLSGKATGTLPIPSDFQVEARQLLGGLEERRLALMVWPALDAYEILEGESMQHRLDELGLS